MSTITSPSRAGPPANSSAASQAESHADSAIRSAFNTSRSTRPLCDNSQRPDANGAEAVSSIGIPTVADRTAAMMQGERSAGETDANEVAPQRSRERSALPGPRGRVICRPAAPLAPSDSSRSAPRSHRVEPHAPAVGVHQPARLAAWSVRLAKQAERRVEDQRRHRPRCPEPAHVTAHQASQARRTPQKICRRNGRSQLRNDGRIALAATAHEPPRSTL